MVLRAIVLAMTFAVSTLPASEAGSIPQALAGRLAQRTVTPPDGAPVAVLSDAGTEAVLDPTRLATCLATIEEAGAWPETWLVVQDEGLDWDLALRLTRDDAGAVAPGEAVALARRDWDPDLLKDALRDALGRKPRGKVRNVVVQGFRKRVVTVYPYEPAEVRPASRGLLALLPEGTVLREARSIDLGDGRRHTLALVLRDARFEPVDCGTPGGAAYGHLDRGTILAVLAGPDAIEAEVDLTPYLRIGPDADAALPRYRCSAGESPASLDPARVRDWIRSRDPDPLLDRVDVDGDGRALEIRLPRATADGSSDGIVLAVDPEGPRLVVSDGGADGGAG